MNIVKIVEKAYADGGGTTGGTVNLPNPLNTNSITEVVKNITGWLITVATPVVAVMVIIGAFQMLFAGGSEEKFRNGKKTITYSVIGFVIVLLAKGIAAIIQAIATNTAP